MARRLDTINSVNAQPFAYDIAVDIFTKGEVFDDKAISVSIQNILSTLFRERVFIPSFGSTLPLVLFENITENNAQNIFNEIIRAIQTWETRITIDRSNSLINILCDLNTIELKIQYTINRTGVTTTFKRNVLL